MNKGEQVAGKVVPSTEDHEIPPGLEQVVLTD